MAARLRRKPARAPPGNPGHSTPEPELQVLLCTVLHLARRDLASGARTIPIDPSSLWCASSPDWSQKRIARAALAWNEVIARTSRLPIQSRPKRDVLALSKSATQLWEAVGDAYPFPRSRGAPPHSRRRRRHLAAQRP